MIYGLIAGIVIIVVTIVIAVLVARKNDKDTASSRIFIRSKMESFQKNGLNSIDKDGLGLQKSEIAYVKYQLTLNRERYLQSGTKIDIYYSGPVVVTNKGIVIYKDGTPRRLLFKNMAENFNIKNGVFTQKHISFRYNKWSFKISLHLKSDEEFVSALFFVRQNLAKIVATDSDLSF